MTRNEKINFVLRLLVVGFGLVVFYHGWMRHLGLGYPYDTFLFRSTNLFGDFWNTWKRASLPYAFHDREGIYPPLNYVLLSILQHLERSQALMLFLGSSLVAFLLINGYFLRDAKPVVTAGRSLLLTLCSYPFWIALNRANLEVWAFLLAVLWMFFYHCGHRKAALLCLVVAVNLKPFTALLSLLYVARRQWRSLAALAVLSALLFVFSLSLMPGDSGENMRRLVSNLGLYNARYAAGNAGMVMGHSVFGVLKIGIGALAPGGPMAFNAAALMKPYLVATLLAMGGIAVLLSQVKLQWWAQLMLLVGALDLLPYVSADYKLLYVFLPFFTWVNAPQASSSPRYDAIVATLFALALLPKNIGHLWNDEVSLGTVLNPALLLALCVAATYARIHPADEHRSLTPS